MHDLGDIGGSQRDDCLPETQHGTNDLMAGIEGDSAIDRAEEHCHDSIKKDRTVFMVGMWQVA